MFFFSSTQPATTCCALYALALARFRIPCSSVLSVLPLLLQGVALSDLLYWPEVILLPTLLEVF